MEKDNEVEQRAIKEEYGKGGKQEIKIGKERDDGRKGGSKRKDRQEGEVG